MDILGFSTVFKVRQCSECQKDTEFYCNTCKHNLCLQCKERHVIDLDTVYHDAVVYREKYEFFLKQEICERHPGRIYEMFCISCQLPVCEQCIEHRERILFPVCYQSTEMKEHNILDIRKSYQTKRKQCRKIISRIRSETLYSSCFILSEIKTNVKVSHTEIYNYQKEMTIKAHRLKGLINNMMCDIKMRHQHFILKLNQQFRKMNRLLVSIENYEQRSEQSANRPIQFLSFQKKPFVSKINDTPNLLQHIQLPLTEEISKEDVNELLSEIQITGQIRNVRLLKQMSSPILHRSVTVTGISDVKHISHVTSDQVWISDWNNNLILSNKEGDKLHHLTDISRHYGVHTVNILGDLINIDKDHNISKISRDYRTKKTKPWIPRCVYCSPSNGDLLVVMYNTDEYTAKVTHCKNTGQHIKTIQYDNRSQELYREPIYVTENRNGDVIVSDWNRGVVVTERGGRHRFSYTGTPSTSRIKIRPRGICTDALSHILVCDLKTHTVQMIDKDGHFLSLIETQQQELYRPQSLSYDDKTHCFWVGSWNNNKVCVYRYISRQVYDSSM